MAHGDLGQRSAHVPRGDCDLRIDARPNAQRGRDPDGDGRAGNHAKGRQLPRPRAGTREDGYDVLTPRAFMAASIVSPMSAGDSETAIPAAASAAFFSAAVPLPPAMIAPAWPMRLPGGAVAPAMNAATGFFEPLFA